MPAIRLRGKHACRRTWSLPAARGNRATRYMHRTGDTLAAKEMKEYGAVIEVVPQERLFHTALELAKRIVRKSPIASKFANNALNKIEYVDLKEGYEFEQGLTGELSGYEDSKEAVRAFFEEREPVFEGR